MQTEKVRERFRVERERLGLPPKEEVLVGSHGIWFRRSRLRRRLGVLMRIWRGARMLILGRMWRRWWAVRSLCKRNQLRKIVRSCYRGIMG